MCHFFLQSLFAAVVFIVVTLLLLPFWFQFQFCLLYLTDVVIPVLSGWAGLCSRGLQDRLLRTMAAISSSMSTSSGLR